MTEPRQLPVPAPGRVAAERFVATHLDGLYCESTAKTSASGRHFDRSVEPESSLNGVVSSQSIRGGQRAANAALDNLDLRGYAANRNNAYPVSTRAASGLSPYIRHGMIDLPRLWAATETQLQAGVDEHDVVRFQTEILWQEYSRHSYAANPHPAGRRQVDNVGRVDQKKLDFNHPAWDASMGCLELAAQELEDDGWLVGLTRMWLASDWVNRQGRHWRDGEDYFFAHLLDGSRAANRAGWAIVSGRAGREPYLYSRWDVELRAPGLCASCDRVNDCPVERPYDDVLLRNRVRADQPVAETTRRPADAGPETHGSLGHRQEIDYSNGYGGPMYPERPYGSETLPSAVWITAESMGDADPALAANPELPVIFVFDRPLLKRLQLSSKRLVFLTETLADLATRRDTRIWLGSPKEVLTDVETSVTWTPVPGWRRLARKVRPVETHPWPWLHQPLSSADLGRIIDQITADTSVRGFEVGLAAGFSKWCERVAGMSPEHAATTAIPTVIGDMTPAGKVS